MNRTDLFVASWLLVGGFVDWYLIANGADTITDRFRFWAYRWPWTPGVVGATLFFAWAHLYVEELFWRR